MTTYAEYLSRARDHHARVGNHVGAYFAPAFDRQNAPCCMLGAVSVAVNGDFARFAALRRHMSGVIESLTEQSLVGDFSDNASDSERADMWAAIISAAPDIHL